MSFINNTAKDGFSIDALVGGGEFTPHAQAIYVGVGGDVTGVTVEGTTLTWTVPSGGTIACAIKNVTAADATGLIGYIP